MDKRKKSISEELSERFPKKQEDENPDKRKPKPDDQNEEKGPPFKEMPIKSNPHQEEILG